MRSTTISSGASIPSISGCWRERPAVVALAVIAALAGVDMAVCLIILTLAPAVTVVGYETLGHRHQVEVLAVEETPH